MVAVVVSRTLSKSSLPSSSIENAVCKAFDLARYPICGGVYDVQALNYTTGKLPVSSFCSTLPINLNTNGAFTCKYIVLPRLPVPWVGPEQIGLFSHYKLRYHLLKLWDRWQSWEPSWQVEGWKLTQKTFCRYLSKQCPSEPTVFYQITYLALLIIIGVFKPQI